MSDGCTSGCAGETSVCDQSYAGTKSHTCDGRSRVQHLTHARTALRSLVTDDNNIASHDLAALDRCNRVFLTVKYTRWSLMYQHLRCNGRTFYNACIRCQVSFQDRNTASLAVRIVDRSDNLRILVDTALDILANGLAGYGHAVQIQKVLLGQLIHNRIHAACLVQILHIGRTCRCQMAQVRGALAHLIDQLHVQVYACLMCNRRKMQHTVGRTSECHIHGQCI